ncbi:hypothetical protein [Natrinema caseinilyticum]|uniref:hypothetical protein n=1 Tax=Natrinema caseinilyticum TaxID=2961570 RepID=UPI0020C52948|nr:hypothetical protein [Natrinema caseinilyticum]
MSASPTDALISDADITTYVEDQSTQKEQSASDTADGHGSPAAADESDDPRGGDGTAGQPTETAPTNDFAGPGAADSSQASTTAVPESDGAPVARSSPSTREDVILRDDLEAVTERVQFLRRVFEREIESSTDSSDRARSQLAITQEIEADLERLLTE